MSDATTALTVGYGAAEIAAGVAAERTGAYLPLIGAKNCQQLLEILSPDYGIRPSAAVIFN
jgi:hypothetical protein